MLLGTTCLYSFVGYFIFTEMLRPSIKQLLKLTNPDLSKCHPKASDMYILRLRKLTQASSSCYFPTDKCVHNINWKANVLFKFLSFIDVNAYAYYLQYFPSPWHGCLMFHNSAWVIPPKGKTLVLIMDKNGWALGSSMSILVYWIE